MKTNTSTSGGVSAAVTLMPDVKPEYDIDVRLCALETRIKQLETEVREFIACLRRSRLSEIGDYERLLHISPTTAQIRASAHGRNTTTVET